MADPTTLATAITTGALVAFTAWREGLQPWLRRRERRHGADSERPSRSEIASNVADAVDHTKLRSDVDNVLKLVEDLRGAHERFARETADRFQHFASADAVATLTATTGQTLLQLTDKVAEVRGMVAALQPSRPGRY